ncbi:MAG: alpha/beta hydrolase [Hamadaea sp.]|nr:alpha/beta hydrolase [Hamadaea sp.]
MSDYLDFTGPAELRTRGTVLIAPGRGESQNSYLRLATRLAADSYRVRVVPAPIVDADDVAGSLDRYASVLADAVKGVCAAPSRDADPDAASHSDDGTRVAEDRPVAPLVVIGADTAAAVVAALADRAEPEAAWWPAAVVLAGLPSYAVHEVGGWDDELDARTHCSVHRGVLSGDPAVQPGTLAGPVPARLLDLAYQTESALPHLILSGDADPYADRDQLTSLARRLPLARLSVVRGAHHDVLNDLQHRTVAAEIVSFLEALRAGGPLRPIAHSVHSAW